VRGGQPDGAGAVVTWYRRLCPIEQPEVESEVQRQADRLDETQVPAAGTSQPQAVAVNARTTARGRNGQTGHRTLREIIRGDGG
jgi:hypothetical protein